MSLVEAFHTTWFIARDTFGDDRPLDGGFPGDALGRLQADVAGAGSGAMWSGSAADGYDDVNSRHAQSFTALAELDRRLTVHFDELAAVVTAGRDQLDDVRSWIADLVASLPPDVRADDELLPVLGQAIQRVVEVIVRSHSAVTAVAVGIGALTGEYMDVRGQRLGGSGEHGSSGGAETSATVDPVEVDPDGVRNLARVQSDVATDLDAAVRAAGDELAGFERRYGPIASPALNPLGVIVAARGAVLADLSRTSGELSELLAGAAQAYASADEAEAAALRDVDIDEA